VLVGCGRLARIRWVILWRRAKPEERFVRLLNCGRRARREENRTAEEMANGTAGSPNPYGRYDDGLKL
jgi:hypothetical protein